MQDLYDFLHSGRPLPSKPVILTFDDGYLDAYTNAFPLLKKYGLSATFFIFTGAIGFNQNYLSWNEIQEMSSAGMSIESHTYTHPDMRNRSDEFLQSQIRLPVDAIAKATGKRPRFFAYPAGQFDANAVRMLIANDTLGAVTTRPGMIHQLGNALTWDRVRVTGNMPLGALVQIIGN